MFYHLWWRSKTIFEYLKTFSSLNAAVDWQSDYVQRLPQATPNTTDDNWYVIVGPGKSQTNGLQRIDLSAAKFLSALEAQQARQVLLAEMSQGIRKPTVKWGTRDHGKRRGW